MESTIQSVQSQSDQSSQSSAPTKIRIENLVKVFGKDPERALKQFEQGYTRDAIFQATGNVLAVAGINVEIKAGELFVIMGLSGSGKSTMVRCLNRLIPPTGGHVYIDNEDVLAADDVRLRQIRRTKVAMVFQKFGLFPHKTVVENTEYGLKVQGVDPTQRRQKALETLEIVGLRQWADRLPSNLSGGMQQRVGLARALATDPDILLMDEAFSALDPLIRRDMQDELMRLQDSFHKTIVFITHDIQEALKIGDRVAVMRDGYFVQVGTPEDIITNPADDYIARFTADVNRAQVLKTGSIARKTIHVILGRDSLRAAQEQMQIHNLDELYVVDRHGFPAGIIREASLAQAMQQGETDISTAMVTDFPKVDATTSLEDVFRYLDQDIPIAVVDSSGHFKGIVEQSDILSSIGRLNQSMSLEDPVGDQPVPPLAS